jgi:anti-sigma regulatory factor (Ser/Thr protein kinase)
MKREHKFSNQVQDLPGVTEFVEMVCEELGIDFHISLKLQLAIEEMATNVVLYAYPEGTSAEITLTAESDDKQLVFVLSDTGKPFDPTAKEDADIIANPMDREQGGMGILIVKKIMNEVSYQRLGDENRLTMKKEL